MHSDAAGAAAVGLYWRQLWFTALWPKAWHESGLTKGLTFLEFFLMLVAVVLWAQPFKNTSLRFWCDNKDVVHIKIFRIRRAL